VKKDDYSSDSEYSSGPARDKNAKSDAKTITTRNVQGAVTKKSAISTNVKATPAISTNVKATPPPTGVKSTPPQADEWRTVEGNGRSGDSKSRGQGKKESKPIVIESHKAAETKEVETKALQTKPPQSTPLQTKPQQTKTNMLMSLFQTKPKTPKESEIQQQNIKQIPDNGKVGNNSGPTGNTMKSTGPQMSGNANKAPKAQTSSPQKNAVQAAEPVTKGSANSGNTDSNAMIPQTPSFNSGAQSFNVVAPTAVASPQPQPPLVLNTEKKLQPEKGGSNSNTGNSNTGANGNTGRLQDGIGGEAQGEEEESEYTYESEEGEYEMSEDELKKQGDVKKKEEGGSDKKSDKSKKGKQRKESEDSGREQLRNQHDDPKEQLRNQFANMGLDDQAKSPKNKILILKGVATENPVLGKKNSGDEKSEEKKSEDGSSAVDRKSAVVAKKGDNIEGDNNDGVEKPAAILKKEVKEGEHKGEKEGEQKGEKKEVSKEVNKIPENQVQQPQVQQPTNSGNLFIRGAKKIGKGVVYAAAAYKAGQMGASLYDGYHGEGSILLMLEQK
jgi:hypothetical protein